MAKQLNVNLAFTADTSQAASQIQNLQKMLNQLTTNANLNNKLGLNKELTEATNQVTKLKSILSTSTDKDTGLLNFNTFNAEIKKSGIGIDQYAKSLNKLGPDGAKAFSQISAAVSNANLSFNKANGLISELWTTMKNTLRWQLTSSALHSFIGGLEQAYGYAQHLNKALTDIRIVAPEKSLGDMADFAKIANQQAKELSTSTLDYVNGALIYYQQGLSDLETQARTDVTMKMKNVTGDSAEDVSSYMTAIWNNFNKNGEQSEEYYADILAKLGADTAASTSEITSALEKYSAVADTIGLSYEAATAAATTLIDRTREAPEVAGTALKTVFARLQGLKLNGEVTDEDGITTDLNKYSTGLASVGVQIKDANGELKNADVILEEIGGKWKTLDRDQQVALAQTVAGLRQYNQFAALMDNYDYYEKYKEIAETGSAGTLQEQQDIYAESWEGAANRVKAAMEGIYQAVLDDSFFITLTNGFADILNVVGDLAEGLGGLKTILPLLSALMLKTFGSQISNSIGSASEKLALMTKSGKQALIADKQKWNQALINNSKEDGTVVGDTIANVNKQRGELNNKLIETQMNLKASNKELTESEEQYVQSLMDTNRALGNKNIEEAKTLQGAKEIDKKADINLDRLFNTSENTKLENFSAHRENFQNNMDKAVNQASLAELGRVYESDFVQLQNKALKQQAENIPFNSSQAKKEIQQYIESFKEAAKISDINTAEIEQNLDNLANVNSFDDLKAEIDSLISKFLELEDASKISQNSAKQAVEEAGIADVDALNAVIDNKINTAVDKTNAAGEFQKTNEKLNTNNADLEKTIGDLNKKYYTGSQAITASTEAMMAMLGASMALVNVFQTLNNEEATFTEKIMAVGMGFMTVIPAITSLTSAMKVLNGMNLATTIASLQTTGGIIAEGAAAKGATVGIKGLGNALKSLLFANPLVTAGVVALSLAIAGCVALFKSMYNEAHEARQNFEHLSESAEIATKNLSEIKTKTNEINDTLEGLKDKRDALDSLTYGTRQWKNAVNELNNEVIKTVRESNNMSDALTDTQKEEALTTVNKKLKDAGLDETKTIDLKLNEDYFYDSEGVLQYTASGEIKLDTVNTILVDQATINANAAEIAKNNAEIEANKEKIVSGEWGQGKQYDHSKQYSEQNVENTVRGRSVIRTADTSGSLSEEGYNTIMTAFANGELNAQSDMNRNSGLIETLDLSESDKDLILSNSELREALYNDADAVARLTESNEVLATNDINNNEAVNQAIKDSKILTEEDKSTYDSGIKQNMAEDVADYTKTYAEDPYKYGLIKKDETLEEYKDDYAKAHNIEEGSKEYKAITNDDIANMLAYNKALEEVEGNINKYIETVQDTKIAKKAFSQIQDIWNDNSDSMKEATTAIASYNKTLKDTFKSTKSMETATKKANKEWKKFMSTDAGKKFGNMCDKIRPKLKEAFQIKDDGNNLFSNKFIAKHQKDIDKAMDGDIKAFTRVQNALAKEEINKLDINFDQIDAVNSLKELKGQLDDFINKDYEVGVNLDKDPFIKSLLELNRQGEMSRDELENTLNNLNVEYEVGQITVPFDSENNTIDASKLTSTQKGSLGIADVDENGVPTDLKHVPVNDSWSIDSSMVKNTKDGQKITIPYIKGKGMTKGAPNVPSVGGGNRGKNPGGRGGGSGGGGGRPSGGRRSRPARHQTKESKVDRYKDVTNKIEKVNRASEKLKDTQEQLYGKKRLNNMDEVNAKLKEELKYINEKNIRTRKFLELDRQRLQQDYDALKNQLKKSKAKINIGIADFTFDSTGRINNYNTIMDKLQNELDKHIDKMNKQKNEDKQNAYKEKYIEPIEETIDGIQSLVDQYEETYEEMLSQIDDWQDKYNEILDNNYEKITYQIELDTTISDNAESLLDYYLDKIEDSSYKVGELFNLYFGSEGQLAQIENKIGIYTDKKFDDAISGEKVDYLQHLSDAYLAGEITQASYVEGLQEEYDAMLDNLGALSDLKDNMDDYYNNILSEVQDEIDKYTQSVEYAAQALEHWRNLIELTGDGKEYNQLIMIQKQLRDNAEQTYNNSIKYYNELIGNVEEFKKQNKDLLPKYNEEQLTKYKEELNAMIAVAEEAGDQVMSDYENLLETAQGLLELELEQANKAIDELLSGVAGGFEELTRIMDLTSTGQDEYLTKTNQIYEMNKLLRNLRTDMDKTENKSAKQRLNNFAKELEQLKQKDELSQLELDIAEARYKQLQAQIALEEAQNAKQTIRLSRDNEGNYGYVYTANEDAVNDAQQALDDASNELYNIYLTGNNDYNEKIISYAQEMLQNIQEINENQELSQAEKDDRIEKIREQYGSLIGDASDLVDIAKQGLINEFNASGDAWTNKYDDNVSSILTNLSSGIDDWLDSINITKNEFKDLADRYKDLEQGIIDTGINLGEQAQDALTGPDGIFTKGLDVLDTAINNLTNYISVNLPEINNELSSLENLVRQIKDMIALEVTEGVKTYFNYNELIKYLSESQGSNGKQVSYNTKLNAAGGRVLTDSSGNEFFTTPAENIDNDAIAEDIYQNYIKQGKHGVISYDKDGKLIFAASESAIVSDQEYTNLTKKLANKDSNARVLRFASGGYTGSWNGEQGKLALLDKKELVLNEYDTQNLLSSVDIIRSVVDQIDLQTMANTISGLTSATIGNIDNSSSVDQNVVISADFPNVSSRDEIEAAFDNLINRAAQYSYRNK